MQRLACLNEPFRKALGSLDLQRQRARQRHQQQQQAAPAGSSDHPAGPQQGSFQAGSCGEPHKPAASQASTLSPVHQQQQGRIQMPWDHEQYEHGDSQQYKQQAPHSDGPVRSVGGGGGGSGAAGRETARQQAAGGAGSGAGGAVGGQRKPRALPVWED